ncbi:MAG: SLATT domain-containing protein [Nitrosopumilus sp.]|nr:SLATT domain-containing protein [Nitrosopumilus sp.]
MSEEKKLPKIWHPQQEKILKAWGEAAACYRYMHYQAYCSYKNLSMKFTIPLIIVSTITGTANFAQETFPPTVQPFVPSAIGGLNLITAIATTIMQFLKINDLMEGHRVASEQYGKISRTIRLELTLPLSERTQNGTNMIENMRAEYDRLIEQSPNVPKKMIDSFEREFPDDNAFFKPEIMHIQPIIPFKAIAENTIITKLKDAVGGAAKRELKKELEDIRGNIQTAKKTIKSDIEGKQQRINEISELKDKGIVSLKGDLMKEIRRRTELMEVVTEIPKDETDITESSTDDSKDKQS